MTQTCCRQQSSLVARQHEVQAKLSLATPWPDFFKPWLREVNSKKVLQLLPLGVGPMPLQEPKTTTKGDKRVRQTCAHRGGQGVARLAAHKHCRRCLYHLDLLAYGLCFSRRSLGHSFCLCHWSLHLCNWSLLSFGLCDWSLHHWCILSFGLCHWSLCHWRLHCAVCRLLLCCWGLCCGRSAVRYFVLGLHLRCWCIRCWGLHCYCRFLSLHSGWVLQESCVGCLLLLWRGGLRGLASFAAHGGYGVGCGGEERG